MASTLPGYEPEILAVPPLVLVDSALKPWPVMTRTLFARIPEAPCPRVSRAKPATSASVDVTPVNAAARAEPKTAASIPPSAPITDLSNMRPTSGSSSQSPSLIGYMTLRSSGLTPGFCTPGRLTFTGNLSHQSGLVQTGSLLTSFTPKYLYEVIVVTCRVGST